MSSPHDASLRAAADAALEFLSGLPERRVRPDVPRGELEAALGGPLPEQPSDPVAVVKALAAGADLGLLQSQSPRFFGFVQGGAHPAAMAADWLATAWDQNAVLYATSPSSAVVERIAADWMLQLLGLPSGSSVGFVTGGQMATWTCLVAARHKVLADVGWDVECDGLHGAPPVHVVVGEEHHGTVDRALRFLGLGAGRALTVTVDEQGRMLPGALEAVLAALEGPTIVVAEAGNVNTGSFDPMEPITAMAHRRGAWVHVDGAFGLWAQASARRRHLTRGVDRADSWSVDAHKWLNVPYDSGLAIVRDPEAHRGALGYRANYLMANEDARYDPLNWSPEHSRRARGFSVWAAIAALGRSGVENLVDRLCDRAEQFAHSLAQVEGIEILNDVVLNQVLVRFTGAADPDEHTRTVIEGVQADGTCWMSGTVWRGKAAMRISVSNWATTEQDVERSVETIRRCSAAAMADS